MKKKVLAFSCFVFLTLASPSRAIDFPREIFDEIDFPQEEKDDIIFSDQTYTNPTHNFSPGQTVYIRVEAFGGEKGKTLRLLDAEKKEVKRLIFNQEGNVFTASFTAPETSGVYYVDIKIEGEGSSFASQENINVGKGCASCSVSSEAESSVVQTEKITPTISPTPTPTVSATPTPPPDKITPPSFIFRIIQFVRTMLSNLTGLFK